MATSRRASRRVLLLILVLAMSLPLPAVAAHALSGGESRHVEGVSVVRVSGPDRVATSVAASGAAWSTSDTVVIARADEPADALTGAALAGAVDAPLLISRSDRLTPEAADEIRRLGAREAYVLGGSAALSDAVVNALRDLGVERVERVSGRDRFATAAAVAQRLSPEPGGTVVLVGTWPDAISTSGLVARRAADGTPWPVLLAGGGLPEATRSALHDLAPDRVVVVGGPSAVASSVDEQVRELGYEVERIAGVDRFDTSLRIASLDTGPAARPLVVATGRDFPDGLAAGALAARIGGRLLLSPPDVIHQCQVDWLTRRRGEHDGIVVVGGEAAVTAEVVDAIARAAGPPTTSTPRGRSTGSQPDDPQTPEVRTPDVVLHVDGVRGEDGATGSETEPLATIGEAAARARVHNVADRAVHVLVHEGTYRESISIQPGSLEMTDAPITIEGVGDVVVSGSEVFDGWTPVGDGVYQHDWDEDWGVWPIPERWYNSPASEHLERFPVTRRREMVFVDRAPLRQVIDLSELAVGDFHVDEPGDRILIRPEDGTDLATALVEVARRDELLTLGGLRNVTVRNVDFQHSADDLRGGAVSINRSRRVELVDSRVVDNNGRGITLYGSADVTLRRVVADENGVGGLGGSRIDDLLVEDSQTSHNGWRGWRGAEEIGTDEVVDPTFVDFTGGQKLLNTDGVTIRRHQAASNLSGGLWFDFDNRDVVVEDSRFVDNASWGVFFEASPGPFRVSGNRFCGGEVGLLVASSSDGTVSDNVFADASKYQLMFRGPVRAVQDRDGVSYEVQTERWAMTGNTVAAAGSQSAIGTRQLKDLWPDLVGTLSASGNTYLTAAADLAFVIPEGQGGLDVWQEATGQDLDSTSEAGTVSCRG